ncbi:uncharacterized protein Dwil_GK23968 [Drosophila willistoni]|uniref:Uncharacterized protein n=1 Tax=Drosophila willistoni TaxID=7260 RepID=B4MU39_DROWI|nr:ras guanine nucleotide exchange factor G [Drosophila willistoni]XP_023031207.1 ras guanine nucleotide exchange factor G [Drosophila willistoni]EDW75628.2 uncharacterized protein Dwil_GK23968 [Drosophila willistoni]
MTMKAARNQVYGPKVLIWLLLLLLAMPPQMVDGRYLPTRSHGDDLDKLRELMLQILELSNEDPQQQQQQQQQQPLQQQQQHPLLRLHNEGNNPLLANSQRGSNSNAAWLQKLSAMGALDEQGGGYGRY